MANNENRSATLGSKLFLGVGLLLYGAVTAAAPRFGEETLNLKLGGFLSEFDTEVAVTGPNGGNGIDLEEVLGLDSDQTSFRGELMWRFALRHRVILGYYRFDRSATTVLEGAIEIDDPDEGLIEFEAGVVADAELDWQLIPVSYAYSFYKTEQSCDSSRAIRRAFSARNLVSSSDWFGIELDWLPENLNLPQYPDINPRNVGSQRQAFVSGSALIPG